MKIVKNILIGLSILLVVMNTIPYLMDGIHIPKDLGSANKIAYFVGFNLGFILALGLSFTAYLIGRNIKRKADRKMVDSLFE